ncbi:MAG: T9SS type A sorting domain-containing protein [Flavobacteriales bacterium]|nr:T9SS type A sorting domain-containing protein [Flavobacteriales bacterium]
MRTVLRITLYTVAAFLAATVTCGQWNFTVDPSFQTQITQQNVGSLLLNEDGTLIASGIMRFSGEMSDKRLARFNLDGARDETYYNSGLGGAKLVQWQDRYYVGASQTIRRIQPSGQQDMSFIEMNLGPYFSSLQGGDYHVYPDGRVLMSGTHTLSDVARGFVGNYNLVWFSNTGYLDTTRVHKRGNGPIYRFGQYADGGFLCSGNASMYEGQPVDKIFRVDSLGVLDTNFQSDVYLGRAVAFLPLPDGRMYAAGTFWRTDAPPESLWLVRFMPDGSLDPTWTAPQLTVPQYLLDQDSNAATIAFLQQWGTDGSVVACGQFNGVNGQERWGICVLDSTGAVLPPFNNCEIGPLPSGSTTNLAVYGLAFTLDSQYVYVHGSYMGFSDGSIDDPAQAFISRLHVGDISTSIPLQPPSPMPSFRLQPNPASTSVAFNYALNSNVDQGRIIVRDLSGRTLETIRFSGQEGQRVWDTRDLVAGVYTVEFFNGSDLLHTEKLIIQP